MIKKLSSQLTPLKVLGFCCILLALAIAACKKNDTDKLTEQNELEKWYIQNKPATRLSYFDDMKPQWESIYTTEPTSELIVYEVKLSNPKNVYQKLADGAKKDNTHLRNQIRLLLFKDKITGQIISSCYMSVLNEGDISNNLEEIHYKYVNDLSGKIMFFSMLGKLENGWEYNKGTITMRINGSLEGYYFGYKPVLGDLKNPAIGKTGSRFDKLMTYTPEPCAFPQPDWRTSCVGVDGYMECTTYLAGYFCVDQTPGGGEGGYNPYPVNPGHGGGGSNTPSTPAAKEIIDSVQNTCIKTQVNIALTAPTTIRTMLNETFGDSILYESLNLTFKDVSILPDTIAGDARRWSGTSTDFEIRLNANMLPKYSKEYTLSTIYHEILHAYMFSKLTPGPDKKYNISTQHEDMAQKYVILMTGALRIAFKGITDQEAWALSWCGLESTNLYTKKLNKQQRDLIEDINRKYTNRPKPGTTTEFIKKGTYCN